MSLYFSGEDIANDQNFTTYTFNMYKTICMCYVLEYKDE